MACKTPKPQHSKDLGGLQRDLRNLPGVRVYHPRLRKLAQSLANARLCCKIGHTCNCSGLIAGLTAPTHAAAPEICSHTCHRATSPRGHAATEQRGAQSERSQRERTLQNLFSSITAAALIPPRSCHMTKPHTCQAAQYVGYTCNCLPRLRTLAESQEIARHCFSTMGLNGVQNPEASAQ